MLFEESLKRKNRENLKQLIVEAGRKDIINLEQVSDILGDLIKEEAVIITNPKALLVAASLKSKSPSKKPPVPPHAPIVKEHPNVCL